MRLVFILRSVLILAISCIFIPSVYASEDLRLLWLFDEGKGNIAKDYSGNRNDGKITNCEWAAGKNGGGIVFNGQSSLIELEHNDAINFEKALTVEAWFRPEGKSSTYAPIARKGGGQGAGDPKSTGWGLDLGSNGSKLRGFIYSEPGTPVVIEGTKDIKTGEWSHVAMAYDGKKIVVYLNGEVEAEIDCKAIGKNTGPLWVGQHVDKKFFLNGVMDELAIWSIARTQNQIRQDSEGIKAAVEPYSKITALWGSLRTE